MSGAQATVSPIPTLPLPPSHDPRVVDAEHRLLSLVDYLTPDAQQQVIQACRFADHAHHQVLRKSGEPYIMHPIAVAEILANLRLDAPTLIAALLHDVIEDTEFSKADLIQLFGDKVAELVDGVTKMTTSTSKQDNKAATFRKILLATLHDPRVIVIKLADRLHNMSTLDAIRPEKQLSTASETYEIFVPMSRLVGLNILGDQLEQWCLAYLEPVLFRHMQSQLETDAALRQQEQAGWIQELERILKPIGHEFRVIPVKNDIVIYRRFLQEEEDIESLIHSHAFDIVVPTVADCDRVAAALTSEFAFAKKQDRIRHPLPGGNQALLLSLRDERGLLDIRLQTARMQEAERLGVVLGDMAPETCRSAIQASLTKLGELIDQECARTTLSALLDYLHRDKIFVYTPDRDVHELPQGATVIDFAYSASLFLGNHAIGARINGQVKPLSTPLQSGQTIQLLTDVLATPNPDWLSSVTTPKARRAIQHSLADLEPEEQRAIGRQALARALKLHQLELGVLPDSVWQDVLQWQHLSSQDQLYRQIAVGDLLPQWVASRMATSSQQRRVQEQAGLGENVALATDTSTLNAHPAQLANDPSTATLTERHFRPLIQGTDGIDVRYAQCCVPLLGDPILGHLTRRGLIVHRRHCHNVSHEAHSHPESVIRLNWESDPVDDPRFPVRLAIDALFGDDDLTELLFLVRQLKAGVEQVSFEHAHTILHLVVRDRDHLARLIRDIRLTYAFPRVVRLNGDQSIASQLDHV